jgi:hypothetical protein
MPRLFSELVVVVSLFVGMWVLIKEFVMILDYFYQRGINSHCKKIRRITSCTSSSRLLKYFYTGSNQYRENKLFAGARKQ